MVCLPQSGLNLRWSHVRKKEILAKIAMHYPEAEWETVWEKVQERCITLGLTTHAKIKRNASIFKAVCVPGYIAYVLVCVYAFNGAKGFVQGFWQLLIILSVMNLIDRFLIDGYWVGHTNAWTIPGTEDLKPYITAKDKQKKWLFGTVGMAVIAAVLARIMMFLMES